MGMENPAAPDLIAIALDLETQRALDRAAGALRSVRVRLGGEATVSAEGPERLGEHLVLGRHAVHPVIEVLSECIGRDGAGEDDPSLRRRLRALRDRIHHEAHARGWA